MCRSNGKTTRYFRIDGHDTPFKPKLFIDSPTRNTGMYALRTEFLPETLGTKVIQSGLCGLLGSHV